MEGVFQALQRVRDSMATSHGSHSPEAPHADPANAASAISRHLVVGPMLQLDRTKLFGNNVVSFDSNTEQTRQYDVLRNLVLDDLSERGSRTIAVTAPTVGCGATVTAANLAFSIARLRTTKVLLLDCNERAPEVGEALGIGAQRDSAADAGTTHHLSLVDIEGIQLLVGSLELLRSRVQSGPNRSGISPVELLKQELGPVTIVMDLPAMLTGDQTLPLILGANIVLLVLAVGHSTVADLDACKTYLSESSQVHVVLNKSRSHGL